MGRLIKGVIYLALMAFIGLVAYAYLGNIEPETKDVRQPVQLEIGQ
jgi:hypothetical protein